MADNFCLALPLHSNHVQKITGIFLHDCTLSCVSSMTSSILVTPSLLPNWLPKRVFTASESSSTDLQLLYSTVTQAGKPRHGVLLCPDFYCITQRRGKRNAQIQQRHRNKISQGFESRRNGRGLWGRLTSADELLRNVWLEISKEIHQGWGWHDSCGRSFIIHKNISWGGVYQTSSLRRKEADP